MKCQGCGAELAVHERPNFASDRDWPVRRKDETEEQWQRRWYYFQRDLDRWPAFCTDCLHKTQVQPGMKGATT